MDIQFKSDINVKTIDKMGDDARLAMAAWVSTSAEDGMRRAVENPQDVPGVINYLMKHRHGTPFEASTMQFFVHAPIFVWREWHRHRIGFSYNEESGRYKTLDPVFYIPDRERPMMKVDKWKPGRPKFLRCEDDAQYGILCSNLITSYQVAYSMYLDNLELGIDPGLARDCLPVGIYSSCWVTCNPRSLMHFLSLRTHDETAKFVSYPLWEIELAAKQVEKMFAEEFPITYKAFVENGRVAPLTRKECMSKLSKVMKSVLLTSGIAADEGDRRQQVSSSYELPNKETRLLAAELVFEEAKELIQALGCRLDTSADKGVVLTQLATSDLDIVQVIDGACDVEYVSKRVLAVCGVPDNPHLKEVCKANERKFPDGKVAKIDQKTGKYLKPDGWKEPNHKRIMSKNVGKTDLVGATKKLVKKFRKKVKK